MGNFYVNYTLRGPHQDEVAAALKGRRARVTPRHKDCIVVFDEASELQQQQVIAKLAAKLSKKLACSCLAVLNHDDDILWYRLYLKGKLADEYNSAPGYFDAKAEPSSPSGGNAAKLCAAFSGDPATVEKVLRTSSFGPDAFVFEVERHAALVEALGISDYAVGTAYASFDNDELPDGLSADDVRDLTLAKSRSSRRQPSVPGEEPAVVALFQAASTDDVGAIRRLIKEVGVDPNVVAQSGHPPLHNACRGGQLEATKTLLELGADLNRRYDYHSISDGLESNRTVLMYAGSSAITKLLLDSGADPNAEDAIGFTPLMQAAMRRDMEAVEQLLAAGANPLPRVRAGKGKTGKNAREIAAGWTEFYQSLPPGPNVTAGIEKISCVVNRLTAAEQQSAGE